MVILLLSLFVLAVWLYFKWTGSYWRRKGNVDGPQPLPFFGNGFEQVVGRKHYGEIFEDVYRSYPTASWVGIYELFNKPSIVVRDLELVKDILVSDFQSFNKNSYEVDESIDPLEAINPFAQWGDKWKERRSQLVPIFSTSKVRATFPIVRDIALNLLDYVDQRCKTGSDVEAKEMCARYTTDSVASCAFGIDAESLTNPNAEFARMVFALFNSHSMLTWFRTMLVLFAPKISSLLKLPVIPRHVDRWFRELVNEVIRQRLCGEVKRQDLFQALYDTLSQNGTVPVKSNEITGHSVTFLAEGYETSSIMMSYLLYELASNPDAQDRVVNEIDSLLDESNGELTDAAVQKLAYMERAMYETLRLHAPLFTLTRVCTKEYELPPQYSADRKRVRITPGTSAVIPISGIHFDADIYPDPYRFDPDRFLEENKSTRHRYSFLSFGEGPRICLGVKFALYQSKIGIASLLSKYRVKLSPQQKLPLEFERNSFFLAPKHGIWLSFVRRK